MPVAALAVDFFRPTCLEIKQGIHYLLSLSYKGHGDTHVYLEHICVPPTFTAEIAYEV